MAEIKSGCVRIVRQIALRALRTQALQRPHQLAFAHEGSHVRRPSRKGAPALAPRPPRRPPAPRTGRSGERPNQYAGCIPRDPSGEKRPRPGPARAGLGGCLGPEAPLVRVDSERASPARPVWLRAGLAPAHATRTASGQQPTTAECTSGTGMSDTEWPQRSRITVAQAARRTIQARACGRGRRQLRDAPGARTCEARTIRVRVCA